MSDYFKMVLTVVAYHSELSSDDILYGKKTDAVVDARWIIVRLLYERGYHTSKIAMLLNMTQRNVTHILTVFQDRLDQYDSLFKSTYQKARVEVGNLKEIHFSISECHVQCFWLRSMSASLKKQNYERK